MSHSFVIEYSPEFIKSPTFTGLAGDWYLFFSSLVLSLRIILDILTVFGNWCQESFHGLTYRISKNSRNNNINSYSFHGFSLIFVTTF